MRVYLDTGLFIDYLLFRSPLVSALRAGSRRGRDPAQLSRDATDCMARLRSHEPFTSAFTLHEAERILFDSVREVARGLDDKYRYTVMSARGLSAQVLTVTDRVGIHVEPLGEEEFRDLLSARDIEARAIRPADSLHVITARRHNAELIITGDGDLLRCDGLLPNRSGVPMRCVDSDAALALI